ncbi:MAG: holo-ACP synthase [Oscillospiraceae bacterium]|jgi:holo-[acyl-carrier protein] synthase
MIAGIGVDAVSIDNMKRIIESSGSLDKSAFVSHTFTRREIEEAGGNAAEYLAARFAVKEAVFKALAHLLPEKTFDLRLIESSHHEDGSPYVVINEFTSGLMEKANVRSLELSVTTEDNMAIAFVVAEG